MNSKLCLVVAGSFLLTSNSAKALDELKSEDNFAPPVVITADLKMNEAPPDRGDVLFVTYEPGERDGDKMPRVKSMLTEEQMKKMVALHDQHRIDTAQKQAELVALKHKLADAFAETNINRNEVTALHAKITALKADLSEARFKVVLASAEILTPEQRRKIHSRVMMRGAMFGMGFDGFPPPPPPPGVHMPPPGVHMPPRMMIGFGGDDDFPIPPFFIPPMGPFHAMMPGAPMDHGCMMSPPHPGNPWTGPGPGGDRGPGHGYGGGPKGPPSDDK